MTTDDVSVIAGGDREVSNSPFFTYRYMPPFSFHASANRLPPEISK